MSDNYGSFIDNYAAYTEKLGGMEEEIGRMRGLKHFIKVTGKRAVLVKRPRKRVLNFGCAHGVNSRELLAMGAEVIGIDKDEKALAVARQRDGRSTYVHYDGLHLAKALHHRHVDGILASFSFCTIEDQTLRPLLEQMRLLLNPGGRLVIIEPNLEMALGTHYPGELTYHPKPGVKNGDHVKVTLGDGEHAEVLFHDIYRTHNHYRRLLKEAGFKIKRFYQTRPSGWRLLMNRMSGRANKEAPWVEVAYKRPPFLVIVAE